MLTKRDLPLLRAALQFFEEEMMPHGTDAMQPYFDEPIEDEYSIDNARRLREWLFAVECRFAVYEPSRTDLRLFVSLEEVTTVAGDDRLIAVVLVPVA